MLFHSYPNNQVRLKQQIQRSQSKHESCYHSPPLQTLHSSILTLQQFTIHTSPTARSNAQELTQLSYRDQPEQSAKFEHYDNTMVGYRLNRSACYSPIAADKGAHVCVLCDR